MQIIVLSYSGKGMGQLMKPSITVGKMSAGCRVFIENKDGFLQCTEIFFFEPLPEGLQCIAFFFFLQIFCYSAFTDKYRMFANRCGVHHTARDRSSIHFINVIVFDASAAQVGGNHEIVWEYEGSAVALDNLTIGCDRAGWYGGGTMMYPNYFDETFYEKYADFAYRVAEHYKDEDTLAAVSVGGFGVYSEPSLNGDLGQWEAYGYSLDRYMEHIERCVDLFKDAFGDSKTVILSAYLEVLPGENGSDPLYLSNKLINYAVDNGVAIKTNSQQAMLTEHGGESGIYWAYAINRYKHRDDVLVFHETAAQCANPDTASYSGHPLSMVNRYRFILNELEGEALSGRKESEEICREMLRKFPAEFVVLTLGPRGAIYADRSGTTRQAAYDVPVVDTTGAGDTFTGYFLSAFAQGKNRAECLKWANAASSLAVGREGAAAGIPLHEEVASFLTSREDR